MLSQPICQQARLSRDRRYDGLFFVAVTSTGIYCRPVCPVQPPKEQNVQYFATAHDAALAGFRPCLRCHPDSAPGSSLWIGADVTLKRAIRLIDEGALQEHNVGALAARLGISERYLRKLFQEKLGISAKQYTLYRQVLFAKQLLHQTALPVTDIAYMAGFGSLRRFHDEFKQQLRLTPSQVRGNRTRHMSPVLQLDLPYRPPLNWPLMKAFYQTRTLEGMEWVSGDTYGRTIYWPLHQPQHHGWFEVTPHATLPQFQLQLHWPDANSLQAVVQHIRRVLDLDADSQTIDSHFAQVGGFDVHGGLRIPGLWSPFEAAVRAILGQQVSIAGARTQLNRLLQGMDNTLLADGRRRFVTPDELANSALAMIKVPAARRATLQALGAAVQQQPQQDPSAWLAIKGIGPWTVSYAQMRGQGEPDVWLGGDLGIQKALKAVAIEPTDFAPWRSYATFQLWHLPKPASN